MQAASDTILVITQMAGQQRDLLPLWTGLLGGVLGVAATFIAAFFSRSATLAQITAQQTIATLEQDLRSKTHQRELSAQFVSANRMRWIETLRQEIASFSATGVAIVTDIQAGVRADQIYPKIDKANHHAAVVTLLLNHSEADSLALVAAIDDFGLMLNASTANASVALDDKKVDSKLKNIGEITRRITKAEWQRVKNFT